MSLFETLLLFIRASREQLWQLHSDSLNKLCPYFFAFVMLNYAYLTPLYIAQMFNLKEKHINTWNMFESGNFSVNKLKFSNSSRDGEYCGKVMYGF